MAFPVHGLDSHAVERLALAVKDPSPEQVAGPQAELDGFHPGATGTSASSGARPGA